MFGRIPIQSPAQTVQTSQSVQSLRSLRSLRSLEVIRRIQALTVTIACAFSGAICPALAVVIPTPAEMRQAIASKKILKSDVQAYYSNGEATINTYAHPKATDNDCKIEAVLVTKVLTADPGFGSAIKSVRVNFYNQSNPTYYRAVVVPEGQIKLFASRAITDQQLLQGVAFTTGRAASAQPTEIRNLQDVASGVQINERITLANNILQLKNQGVDVSRPMAVFMKMEAEVKAKNPDINKIALLHGEANTLVGVLQSDFNKNAAKTNQRVARYEQQKPNSGPQLSRRINIYNKFSLLDSQGVKRTSSGNDLQVVKRKYDQDIAMLIREGAGEEDETFDRYLTAIERELGMR